MGIKKYCFLGVVLIFFGSCATYKTKYLDDKGYTPISSKKEISHTVYLVGDAGLSPMGALNPALKIFKQELDAAASNSTAIFLGDNIYPAGLPEPKDSTRAYLEAKNHLDAQLNTLENYKGRPVFIPGNHDWYNEGLKGLERQEDYIKKRLKQKDPFLPENGCPLETIEVNEDLVIILIDTEWYLANWDNHPNMNDKCGIKSRDKFLLELADEIKDNRQRTTLIALHHPMFSYGPHGGQFSFRQQFYPSSHSNIPLPFLGTLGNVLRKTTGASREDLNNKRYRELRNRITTLAQYSDKVIFASGHEHTLQYIVEKGIPQIVSGSGAKKGVTRLLNGSRFSTGRMGFATLNVYKDGSSSVSYYGVGQDEKKEPLYETQVLPPNRKRMTQSFPEKFPKHVKASIYSKEEIDKTGFFKTIWGERYREYYATEVMAPTVDLDTLLGGLKPVRKGGGNQSKSLRLRHSDGREYVMRALRKKADLYLQAMVFQEQYITDDLQDTFTMELLEDFYTGSHPYAPFTVGTLSDAIGLYHTNPILYYIPKQNALEDFNDEFGDELYMIEEHAGDGHGYLESFGYANELKSTDSMLEDLRDDEKYEVDSEMYLRARLFDMAIGDWDRHVDQWRWAEFKDKDTGKVVYRPIPRDRDQAYSIMGDGLFMGLATRLIPALQLMEGFQEEIRSVKGFNSSPKTYILDLALLTETTPEQWMEQASFIKENLTEDVIDEAFQYFPEEVRDETIKRIKRTLLARVEKIDATAMEYFGIMNKYATIIGTDKDDWFQIERLASGETSVKVYRIIDGEKQKLFFDKTFHPKTTKELWIYGLDDDDRFEVGGTGKSSIRVRLIGGQNNDIYDISNGRKVIIYDHKSKKNTIREAGGAKIKLTNDYETNTYRPLKIRNSTNQFIPTLGFNPDDGIKMGFTDTYTYNGFRQNPFTQQHTFNGAFYFATSGFELGYAGEFAQVFENWNLELAARFTSPNFAVNFFGFGNDTPNFDDDLDLDFNRVKLQTLRFAPSLVWRGQLGAKLSLGVSYETIDVEETENRFINDFAATNNFEPENSFFGVEGEYSFSNSDFQGFPTLGMATSLLAGYKSNVDNSNNFGYIVPSLSFAYKLVSNGRLVLGTKWKAHFNIGDGYEFYQGATLGDLNGLRGFRRERFTGKKAFFQNTDIRYSLRKMHTGLLPTAFGVYAGFDYGRVWQPNEDSDTWHTSYGLGFFANAADILTIRTALFNSADGPRFTFGLGFGF